MRAAGRIFLKLWETDAFSFAFAPAAHRRSQTSAAQLPANAIRGARGDRATAEFFSRGGRAGATKRARA
jgi:hypothetical protein